MLKTLVGCALGVALAISGAYALRPADSNHRTTHALPRQTRPAVDVPAPVKFPAVSARAMAEVGQHGVVLDLLSTSEAFKVLPAAAVSGQEAVRIARASFGFDLDSDVAGVSPSYATTLEYGKQLEPDPNKPSKIDPAIKDRLTWAVSFSAITVPVLGKLGYKGPQTSTGPAIVLVDAATGEFLYALAY